jgi:hypothetical protein
MRSTLTALTLGVLGLGLTTAEAQTTAPTELDRIQMGVVLSPGTAKAMGSQSTVLARAVESALSSLGMGAALPTLGTRFVAYVDLVPIEEQMTPNGMVAVKEQLSITFGDRESGRAIGLFQAEKTAVGNSKETALRNFSTSLRLAQSAEFKDAAKSASDGIIRFFEAQCASLLREAEAQVKQRNFEQAIFMTTSVPREAANCHVKSTEFAGQAYLAMLKHQCSAPFAQAKAKWAASKSRENAAAVAEVLGEIPADSPCFAESSGLVEEVARVIAQHDARAAQAQRDRLAWQKKVYEDRLALTKQQMQDEVNVATQTIAAARDVGVERARAIAKAQPAQVNQTIVFVR